MVERRKIYHMIIVSLKEWKWIGVVLGAWIFFKKFTRPLGFCKIYIFLFGGKAWDLVGRCVV